MTPMAMTSDSRSIPDETFTRVMVLPPLTFFGYAKLVIFGG